MVEVLEHLLCGRLDVELGEGAAERGRESGGVGLGRVAGRETGHREGVDVAAGAAQPVHGLGGDDQRVGRVEAAADADDHLRLSPPIGLCCQPLLEPRDLDVVGLVAVEREAGGVVGDVGVAVDLAQQPDVAGRGDELELDVAEVEGADAEPAPVVVVAPLPDPLLAQPVEVDVDDGRPRDRRGSARSPRAGRRTRRPSSGRPTTGRWSTRPGRPRCRGRPRCSGSWPTAPAVAVPPNARR